MKATPPAVRVELITITILNSISNSSSSSSTTTTNYHNNHEDIVDEGPPGRF